MRTGFLRKLSIFAAAAVFIAVAGYTAAEVRIRPVAEEMARSLARRTATELIDAAVGTLLEDGAPPVSVHRSDAGVASVTVDTRAVALLRTQAVAAVREALASVGRMTVTVPLFNLTGGALTSGFGLPVTVRAVPVGDVTADVRRDFIESGINQTLHTLDLRVKVELCLYLGSRAQTLTLVSDIPLAETVIVGAVPEAYTAINRYEIDEDEENDLNDYAASIP